MVVYGVFRTSREILDMCQPGTTSTTRGNISEKQSKHNLCPLLYFVSCSKTAEPNNPKFGIQIETQVPEIPSKFQLNPTSFAYQIY